MKPSRDFLLFLESPEGSSLLAEFVRRPLRRGQLVSSPGQSENLVFIFRSGRVRVYLAREQRELTLAFLARGDVFSTHTPAWMMATGAIIHVLGLLLSHTVELVETLVFRDAPQRLAHFLVAAARRHNHRDGESWAVPLHFHVTEMALLLGATRQTISSALNEMQRQGIGSREVHRQLLITDMTHLESWGSTEG